MDKNHEVFDADATASEFAPIKVRVGRIVYTMEGGLSGEKMKRILAIDKLPDEEKYNEPAAVLAELLGLPHKTFSDVDIRVISRAADYIQARIKKQSEGKDGSPTAPAPKKSRRSSGRSRASSK